MMTAEQLKAILMQFAVGMISTGAASAAVVRTAVIDVADEFDDEPTWQQFLAELKAIGDIQAMPQEDMASALAALAATKKG